MKVRSSVFQIVVAGGVALSASSCTRTYDGTIVPTYQPRIVNTSALPRLALRRTRVDPPARLYDFPATPPQPAVAAVRRSPPTRSSQRRQRPASGPALAASRTVQCREAISASGRVRVVCM